MDVLATYLHLARAAQLRRRPMSYVRLLLMSAIAAHQLRLHRIADACRELILQSNPNHMVRRWPTIVAALDDPDFLHFLHQVERRYPAEKAERMLQELQIEKANERAAYYNDEEYAASLLGISSDNLDRFGPSPEDA